MQKVGCDVVPQDAYGDIHLDLVFNNGHIQRLRRGLGGFMSLLGAIGTLLGAPGLTTRSKEATRNKGHYNDDTKSAQGHHAH